MKQSKIELGHLKLTIFGLSHSPEIGVYMEGLPAGEPVNLNQLQAFLDRRPPATAKPPPARKEPDRA